MDRADVLRWIQDLGSPSGRGAEHAALMLGKARAVEALPALARALRTAAGWEDLDGANQMADAIVAIGGADAAMIMIASLVMYDDATLDDAANGDVTDEFWRARTALTRGLRGLGVVAVPHLRPLLTHDNRDAARAAASLLAEQGDPATLDTLLAWASDRAESSEDDRCTALVALAGYRDPRVFEVVLAALLEPHDARRCTIRAATGALGRIGDRRAEAPLSQVLGASDPTIRLEACEALGLLGGDQARAALATACEDPDRDVRDVARAALAALGVPGPPG